MVPWSGSLILNTRGAKLVSSKDIRDASGMGMTFIVETKRRYVLLTFVLFKGGCERVILLHYVATVFLTKVLPMQRCALMHGA